MKALIVEDEAPAANRLKSVLTSISKDIMVIDVCPSIQASVTWLKKNVPPDVIFMDIELSDGRSFEIFQQVTITAPVIFVTAYDHLAIKAIKLNALDYLLKPIDKEELENAILKVKKSNTGLKQEYSHLNQAFIKAVSGEKPKKLVVYDSAGARFIDIEKIIRFRADSNYTNIYLSSGEHIISSRTLKAYEELLVGLSFFRVSNAYIINLAYVDKYVKGMGGSLIMNDGTTIEVSKLRKKGLWEALSLNH